MTAQTLSLPQATGNALRAQWLESAWVMAAAVRGGPGPSFRLPDSPWESRPRVATRTVGAELSCVGATRDFTVATLRRWGVGDRGDDIVTVVSELLTNALRHALPACEGGWPPPRPVRFGILQPGSLVLCAVADPSPQVPVPGDPCDLAESGRGLHVVAGLSDAWGYTAPTRLGKVVWAMFGGALPALGRVRTLAGRAGVGRRRWRARRARTTRSVVTTARSPAPGWALVGPPGFPDPDSNSGNHSLTR